MAGLVVWRAIVCVGPPLLANGPSCGSVLLRSVLCVKGQLPSLERLYPCASLRAPLQLGPAVLPATTVAVRSTVRYPVRAMPLALAASVTAVSVARRSPEHPVTARAPPTGAVLALNVLLTMM